MESKSSYAIYNGRIFVLDRNSLREYILDNSGNYHAQVIDKNESGWQADAVLEISNGRLVVLGRNKLKFYSIEN